MTTHDDNPTMLADRVTAELQAMAAELDIAQASPATTVRNGQRRRLQTMLATGGLAAVAVAAVVAVFLAIQPLSTGPDVAQAPHHHASGPRSCSRTPGTPAVDGAAAPERRPRRIGCRPRRR